MKQIGSVEVPQKRIPCSVEVGLIKIAHSVEFFPTVGKFVEKHFAGDFA